MPVVGTSPSSLEPQTIEDGDSLVPHHWTDWKQIEGAFVQCSVGEQQVWGVNREGVYRMSCGYFVLTAYVLFCLVLVHSVVAVRCVTRHSSIQLNVVGTSLPRLDRS